MQFNLCTTVVCNGVPTSTSTNFKLVEWKRTSAKELQLYNNGVSGTPVIQKACQINHLRNKKEKKRKRKLEKGIITPFPTRYNALATSLQNRLGCKWLLSISNRVGQMKLKKLPGQITWELWIVALYLAASNLG